MDDLDVAILRAMGFEPYGRPPQGPDALKPASLAKAVGVRPETVRERVQRLEEEGVIAGYQAFPNLRHLGLESTSFLFRAPEDGRRTAALEAVRRVDGVLAVHGFLGADVCIDLTHAGGSSLARKLDVLSALTGDPEPSCFFGLTMPPVHRALTNLDWRIVRALRGRARRALTEVASEIGVGYRTVKRHYDRLCREGSLYTVPMLDFGRERGLLPFWLLLWLEPDAGEATVAAAREAFASRRLMGQVPSTPRLGNVALLLLADRAADAEDARRRAAGIPGVARARALVPSDLLDASDWIDDAIDAKVEAPAVEGAATRA